MSVPEFTRKNAPYIIQLWNFQTNEIAQYYHWHQKQAYLQFVETNLYLMKKPKEEKFKTVLLDRTKKTTTGDFLCISKAAINFTDAEKQPQVAARDISHPTRASDREEPLKMPS